MLIDYSMCFSFFILKYDFLPRRSAVAVTTQAHQVRGACGPRQRGFGEEATPAGADSSDSESRSLLRERAPGPTRPPAFGLRPSAFGRAPHWRSAAVLGRPLLRLRGAREPPPGSGGSDGRRTVVLGPPGSLAHCRSVALRTSGKKSCSCNGKIF